MILFKRRTKNYPRKSGRLSKERLSHPDLMNNQLLATQSEGKRKKAAVLAATMVGSQTLMELNKNLVQPHLLTVSISRGYIGGTIELNGRVLRYLQGRETRVDLSPR